MNVGIEGSVSGEYFSKEEMIIVCLESTQEPVKASIIEQAEVVTCEPKRPKVRRLDRKRQRLACTTDKKYTLSFLAHVQAGELRQKCNCVVRESAITRCFPFPSGREGIATVCLGSEYRVI